jgi:hypothetical protein
MCAATLLFHSRLGGLAAGIPGARFVALQGQNHLFRENEQASQRFFEELKLFLGN